jgi:hypothetical protein
MILGGAFWLMALVTCIAVASSASTGCRAGHWSIKPQWDTGLSALSVLELTTENRILFDGKEIAWSELGSRLTAIPELPIRPIVVFRPAIGAECRQIVRVRAMMDHSLECKAGGCAEGAEWDGQRPHGPNI